MRKAAIALCGALAIAGCDQIHSQGRTITVDGLQYTVYPNRGAAPVWYASPSDRAYFFNPQPGIRQGNVRAIQAATGCTVIPETINHIDRISTEAEVDCARK